MMDILAGIQTLKHALAHENISQPAEIVLKTHEDGEALVHALIRDGLLGMLKHGSSFATIDEFVAGSAWKKINIDGTVIKWPARKLALPNGTWRWV